MKISPLRVSNTPELQFKVERCIYRLCLVAVEFFNDKDYPHAHIEGLPQKIGRPDPDGG